MNREATKNLKSNESKTRTTVVLPTDLDKHLEIFAVMKGSSKAELIKEAITQFLIQQGLQPDKTPKFSVSY